MPDSRQHRGPDPDDARLFAPEVVPLLRTATSDLCWLLSRDYAIRSATELVGNRYALAARQRLAIARCACSDQAKTSRLGRQLFPDNLEGKELWIDGFNVLAGLEVALSNGVILVGRDGCCRDLAGIHRHYRKVQETIPALELVAGFAAHWKPKRCCWWLDKPVSNSGRLKGWILDLAQARGLPWTVELVYSPDAVLAQTEHVVVTADSAVLDRCQGWLNLARSLIMESVPHAHLVDLSDR